MASEPYRPGAPIVAELASGAVVVQKGSAPPSIAMLHLRDEDRWCLPKGHVDPGESLEAAAAREVREETGLSHVELGSELTEVSYRFYAPGKRANIEKIVVYFLAASSERAFRPERFFDKVDWVTLDQAEKLVRFETERSVLRSARARLTTT